MHKFILAFVLLLVSIHPVKALELSISNPVVNDLEISLSASLSASSNYYLQGVLRSQTSSKYFGETNNGKGEWIDYVSSPEKEYIVSNFFQTDVKNATWSGTLKLRFKIDEPNYLGPGVYDLKLRRFTGNSSGSSGDSNTISLNLTAIPPSPSPSPIETTPSPLPTIAPSPSQSQSTPRTSMYPSPIPAESVTISTVAGVHSEINLEGFGVSPTPLSSTTTEPIPKQLKLNNQRAKTAIIIGIGLMLSSLSAYFIYRRYLYLQQNSI